MKKLTSFFAAENKIVDPDPEDALINRFDASQYITEMRTIDFINPSFPDIVEFYRAMAITFTRNGWNVVRVRVGPDPVSGNRVVSTSAPIAADVSFFSAVRLLAEYQTTCGYVPGAVTADDLGMRHYYYAATLELIAFNRAGLPRPTLDGVLVVPDDYPVTIMDPLFPDRISVDQSLPTRNDIFRTLRDQLTGGDAYAVLVQGFVNHSKLVEFHEKAVFAVSTLRAIRSENHAADTIAATFKDMMSMTKDLAQADRLNGIVALLVFCEQWMRARYAAKDLAAGTTKTDAALNARVQALSAVGAMAGFDDDYINATKATLFSTDDVYLPVEIDDYLQQIKDMVDQQALHNRFGQQMLARTQSSGPR